MLQAGGNKLHRSLTYLVKIRQITRQTTQNVTVYFMVNPTFMPHDTKVTQAAVV